MLKRIATHTLAAYGSVRQRTAAYGGVRQRTAAYGRDRLHREISRSQGVLSQETRYDAAGRITQRTVLDARRELVFDAVTAGTVPTR
ncbi:hypothetical protein SMX26_004047 [Cronobacter universalis]|nr:hypothetical protein [Cronobacter universalis]